MSVNLSSPLARRTPVALATALAAVTFAVPAAAATPARHAAPHSTRRTARRTDSASTTGVLVIDGAGFGHGVGMSQYGAAGYALHGWGYEQILGHYFQGTTIGSTDPGAIVRVLLAASGQPSFSGANRAPGRSLGHRRRLHPAITYTVRPAGGGALELTYRQGGRTRSIGPLRAPLRVAGPGALQLAGHGAYDGALIFRPAGGSGVQSVEAVSLDRYVSGVVPEEMDPGWPAAALEAQAVAARTYAITTDVAGQDFDVYSDTRSQMYGGVSAETSASNEAVAATSGQVVTYQGTPVVTYFSSSSGGHTESVQYAWPGSTPEPWLVGVSDPYDAAEGNPYHRWTVRMSIAAAQRKLASYLRGDGGFTAIKVLRRGTSPRIVSALVQGTGGSRPISGPQLEQALGLRSTWATFTTITSTPGPGDLPASGSGSGGSGSGGSGTGALRHGASGTGAVQALTPLVDSLIAGALRSVHGNVSPAEAGARVLVQKRERRRWRSVVWTRTDRGAYYQVALPGPGVYRVVFRGIAAPPFTAR
jgi:stage II sporulation protein D